jgi:hypothetical protein
MYSRLDDYKIYRARVYYQIQVQYHLYRSLVAEELIFEQVGLTPALTLLTSGHRYRYSSSTSLNMILTPAHDETHDCY